MGFTEAAINGKPTSREASPTCIHPDTTWTYGIERRQDPTPRPRSESGFGRAALVQAPARRRQGCFQCRRTSCASSALLRPVVDGASGGCGAPPGARGSAIETRERAPPTRPAKSLRCILIVVLANGSRKELAGRIAIADLRLAGYETSTRSDRPPDPPMRASRESACRCQYKAVVHNQGFVAEQIREVLRSKLGARQRGLERQAHPRIERQHGLLPPRLACRPRETCSPARACGSTLGGRRAMDTDDRGGHSSRRVVNFLPLGGLPTVGATS